MTAQRSVIDFVSAPDLLGPYFAGASWSLWRAVLKAAFALPLDRAERHLFRVVAGHRKPPSRPVRELVAIVGRGGGKDSIAAALAAFIASTGDFTRLRPGERASILCLAVDRTQAGIAFGYVRGLFENVPLLAGMVARITNDTVELANGAEIIVATNSFRSVRGKTVILAIYDEVAFWASEDYANPDFEVDAAISPGLARCPGSLKILISSAYRRQGLLYQRWREGFGIDDPAALVVLGGTLLFNPSFDARVVERELARDRERASAEYLCRWRDDLVGFIDRAAVEACVVRGCRERGRLDGVAYRAFTDPSGGRGDSFTLAIAHAAPDGHAILDLLREVKPPFSPDAVIGEFAAVLASYGISEVCGDNYAGEFPAERFRSHGIAYQASEKPRSAIYLELLPLINSGRLEFLDNDRLVNQLCALERRVERSGRESVNHPDHGHDDLVNSAAGALTLVAAAAGGPMRARGFWELMRRQAAGLLSLAPVEPEPAPDLALIEAHQHTHPDVPIPRAAYALSVPTGYAPGSTEWQAARVAMSAVPPILAQPSPSAAPAPERCSHGAMPGGCRQCLRQGRYVGIATVTAISGGSA